MLNLQEDLMLQGISGDWNFIVNQTARGLTPMWTIAEFSEWLRERGHPRLAKRFVCTCVLCQADFWKSFDRNVKLDR